MNNPFKKILLFSEVPKFLKKKVLDDIDLIKHTVKVSDLFVKKYPKTISGFIGNKSSKKN